MLWLAPGEFTLVKSYRGSNLCVNEYLYNNYIADLEAAFWENMKTKILGNKEKAAQDGLSLIENSMVELVHLDC